MLGVLWGMALAALPALVMTRPFQVSGFLVAAVICAAVSGAIGTLFAGQRAAVRSEARSGKKRGAVVASLGTGFLQGLVGGAVAAFLIWGLMAVTLSGFTLGSPGGLSVLMSPRIFLGGFFVALSVFVYVLAGGLLLGPAFGTLVNRLVRKGEA
ncbi:MAG TPA: hypothetical protein VHM16_00555 [Rubrobacteraceae bacterium]|nr:hypothetical protein [Rubrobacteraceae bacterium]